jgi:hypothetical protein
MKRFIAVLSGTLLFALTIAIFFSQVSAQIKAQLPVLLTSCGQSLGPINVEVGLKGMTYLYSPFATADTIITLQKKGTPVKSIIIVVGTSLKGMGAAGITIEDEMKRANGLIAECKKQSITVISAHVTGMKNRATGEGVDPSDNTDELSIDAVCPLSAVMIVKKEGNPDGRFTIISKNKNIPLLLYEKNAELSVVLKNLFGVK